MGVKLALIEYTPGEQVLFFLFKGTFFFSEEKRKTAPFGVEHLFRWGKKQEVAKCPKISYNKVSDKMAYANSAGPNQTAPEGAVWLGSTLFAIPLSILRNNCIKGYTLLKINIFFIQVRFNKLIYGMHQTACTISISLSFLNSIKNERIFFYRISELMFATLIQR